MLIMFDFFNIKKINKVSPCSVANKVKNNNFGVNY